MLTLDHPETLEGSSATRVIVNGLTQSIVAHRLPPGAKLSEQKIADQFGVSRTLVRQALFQLSQQRLIRMEPSRGAFVASPSVDEAKQVFAVRRMLEAEMMRAFVHQVTPAQIKVLRTHVKAEQATLKHDDPADRAQRTTLLRGFHVLLADLMGNQVLAELLNELISRCSLITLMYQSTSAAERSSDEHAQIVEALVTKDEALALRLMDEHLLHVQAGLDFASSSQTSP